jgi:hypothetical protein
MVKRMRTFGPKALGNDNSTDAARCVRSCAPPTVCAGRGGERAGGGVARRQAGTQAARGDVTVAVAQACARVELTGGERPRSHAAADQLRTARRRPASVAGVRRVRGAVGLRQRSRVRRLRGERGLRHVSRHERSTAQHGAARRWLTRRGPRTGSALGQRAKSDALRTPPGPGGGPAMPCDQPKRVAASTRPIAALQTMDGSSAE